MKNKREKSFILLLSVLIIGLGLVAFRTYRRHYLYPSILELNPREWALPAMIQMAARNNTPVYSQAPKPLVLAWASDVHGNSVNMSRVMDFCNEYDRYITDIICTGDICQNSAEDFGWWEEKASKVLTSIGNHDVLTGANDGDIGEAACYERYMSNMIGNWGVTSANEGRCYYYKDYPTQKIRLVVLDCMHWSEQQNSWLKRALDNALEEGYSVLAVSHYWAGDIDNVDCTFNSFVNGEPEYLSEDGAKAIQGFIDEGGDFICWLSGHSHRDNIGTLKTYPDQLQLVVNATQSGCGESSEARVWGCRSQDAFNILSIDPDIKTIKILRIGSQYDEYMRKRELLCIDYATKDVIANY